MQARRLSNFIEANASLKPLLEHAKRVTDLQQIYRETAPSQLLDLSRVATVEGGRLVVVTDNGAAAAKLRQMTTRLVKNFVLRGQEITSIRIEVQVSDATPASEPAVPAAPVGPVALANLCELRESLPESNLKQALTNLIAKQTRSLQRD
jgi:hypothetical protein